MSSDTETEVVEGAVNPAIDEEDSWEDDSSESEEGSRNGEGPEEPQEGIIFARNPAKALINKVLNYRKKSDIIYYNKAVECLYNDTDLLFDASSEGLQTFLRLLNARARKYEWTGNSQGVLDIPEHITFNRDGSVRREDGAYMNLLEKYGTIKIEHLKKYASTYMDRTIRPAQDDDMIWECCKASLTSEALNRMMLCEHDFMVKGNVSGVLFVKVLLRESHIDSNATIAALRLEMSSASLAAYLRDVGGDIVKFQAHVANLVSQLAARGKKNEELLTSLFTALKKVEDGQFKRYIEKKEEMWEEDGFDKPLNARRLLDMAVHKYKVLCTKEEWQKMTPEQEKIAALETKLAKVHKQKSNKAKSTDKPKKGDKPSGKPNWLRHNIAPKDKDKKTRQHNSVDWHWCDKSTKGKCGGKWRLHKPSDCKGAGYNPKRDNKKADGKDREEKKKKPKKDPRLARAMESIAQVANEQDADDDDYDSADSG